MYNRQLNRLVFRPQSQQISFGKQYSKDPWGPRKIAVAGNRSYLWGEQHRIETRTKRNHSRVNSRPLTIGGNYSRSPLFLCCFAIGCRFLMATSFPWGPRRDTNRARQTLGETIMNETMAAWAPRALSVFRIFTGLMII